MAYKTVLVVSDTATEMEELIDAALPFAAAHGAHLSALCIGVDRTQMGYYALGDMLSETSLQEARDEARRAEAAARQRLSRAEVAWDVRAIVTQSGIVSAAVGRSARVSDIVIAGRPYGSGKPSDAPALVEGAMFDGGAPVIVVPPGRAVPPKPARVVCAWNDSAEALDAVRAALPVLSAADHVELLMVNPGRHPAGQADPGADISAWLSRHGAPVTVSIVPQTETRVSQTIARHAVDAGADMLVMGAYSHSRFREAILGGATRAMLETAPVPVLMAR